MSHRSRQGWLVFPHMTGRGKGECEKWTKLQRQVPGPLAIPPSSSFEGCPSQKVKDEVEYHAGLSMLTMKRQVGANGLPMALPVVFQAPVCWRHSLFQALDPITDVAPLALAAPLVLQHKGRPASV